MSVYKSSKQITQMCLREVRSLTASVILVFICKMADSANLFMVGSLSRTKPGYKVD